MPLVRLLLGRPLANREFNERKIGTFEGIPAMGLDGARRIHAALLKLGGPRLVVMNIPWRLDERSAAVELESELEAELEQVATEAQVIATELQGSARHAANVISIR